MNDNELRFEGNIIHHTAVIEHNVRMGKGNRIEAFVHIGGVGEVRGEKYIKGIVEIGDNNVIGTGVTIDSPVRGNITAVGNDCMLMKKTHIGHDCQIANGVTISPLASIGGVVVIEEGASIGMGVTVHPRLKIGRYSMIGMNAAVTKDVPEFRKYAGVPAKDIGENTKGIEKYDQSGS